MPPKPLTELRLYNRRLARDTKRFACPYCTTKLLSKQFESHCTKHHQVNARLRCVWCLGKESWIWGQKNDRVDHLLECWKKFTALRAHHPNTRIQFDSKPMCEPRQFFHHSRIPDLPPQAYDEVCPMQLDPIHIFKDPNLNLAATCIRKYFELPNAEVFHVMVRAVAYQSFVDAMEEAGGICVTLPYSCWCDGGKYPQAKHRQHRHMIVICFRKGYFKQEVWIKVITTDRPSNRYLCKRIKPIASAMHLVNALGYLSQPKSRCNFSFNEDNVRENTNHFYIFTPLPADYRFALVTQWDGGILELVHQEFKHADAKKFFHVPMTFFKGRWQIQVKHLPGIPMNVALPISPRLHLSPDPTPFYLHLGNKVYFESHQTQDTAEMVLLYSAVGNEWWIPCQHQQNCLNTLKPISDRNAELESEIASLKRMHEEQEMSWNTEKETLKRKHAYEAESWKRAKLELETENKSLKRKHEAAEEEVKFLLKKVNRMEVDRLETENMHLKNRIICLERQLREARGNERIRP